MRTRVAPYTMGKSTVRSRLILWWLLGFLLVSLALAIGLGLRAERQSHIDRAADQTRAAADFLEDHVVRVIGSTDALLRRASSLMAARDPPTAWHEDRGAWQVLHELAAALPEIGSMVVVDQNGEMVLTTTGFPAPVAAVSDHEYFRAHAAGHRGIYLGPVVRGKIGGIPQFTLSRPIYDRQGRWLGVVAAALEVIRFRDFQLYYRLGPGSTFLVARDGGDVLVRQPHHEGAYDRRISELADRAAAVAAGTYQTTSLIDGLRRIVSYRRHPHYPLLVAVSAAKDDVLAPWRAVAAIVLGGTLVLAGLIAAAVAAAWRLGRREEEAHDDLIRNLELTLGLAPVVLHGEDRDLRYTWMVNQQLPSTPANVVGKRASDLFDPADAARYDALKRRALDTGESVRQTLWLRPVGDAPHCFEIMIEPEHDADGKVRRLRIAATDITAAAQAMRRAEEAEARLRLALEAAGLGLVETDLFSGKSVRTPLVDRLFGYEQGEAGDDPKPLIDRVHPDDIEKVRARYEATRRGEIHGRNLTYRVLWPDGRVVWISSRGAVMHDAAGAPVRALTVMLEVTGEMAAQEQAQQARIEAERANLAKSRFIAAASHDLRQPMQALRLFHEVLVRKISDPQHLAILEKEAAAMEGAERLLTALLDVSRLEAGMIEPQICCFRIGEVLDPLATEGQPQAAEKGLTLRRRFRGGDWVRSDPVLLGRILRNLMVNAVRYTRRGGVLLATRRRDGRLVIEVWDSGPGIPPEKLTSIFEDFYQLENTGEHVRGLGLGLSIVERTARLLDHPVSVRSSPGRGSVFSVTVPLAAPPGIAPMTTATIPV